MSITVIAPVLNEMRFLRAWSANVKRYADEVVVMDTGSSDGSQDFLKAQGFTVLEWKGELLPYNQWPEGEIRQTLLNNSHGDWIVRHDPDELWPDAFFEELPELVKSEELFVRGFHYTFWRSFNLIRIAQFDRPGGKNFYPIATFPVMWKNDKRITYAPIGNHTFPQLNKWGKYSSRLSQIRLDIPLFHYNFASPYQKILGNRSPEFYESGIKCKTYFGKHPKEVDLYDFEGVWL